MDETLHLDALTAHGDWIRSLARTLVTDANAADDVAQEAWLAARESPPRDARNPRGWLTEVVRNLARARARAESRRARRERAVARGVHAPDSTELVAQAELHRMLVGFVLELDEPYRTVVLLRFFRDLSVREIARVQNVPVNTARTRLQRGLAHLRDRLDRRWGERRSWCTALAALAPAARPAGAVSSLGVAAAVAWKAAAVVAMVACFAWWYRAGIRTAPPASSPASSTESTVTQAATRTRATNADSMAEAERAARRELASTRRSDPSASTAATTSTFEGRVVDVRGSPVRGLDVKPRYHRIDPTVPLLGESPVSATTDSNGAFHLEVPGRVNEIEVAGGEWTFVSDGWREHPREHVYIVARAVDVGGIVSDASGLPVPNAHVERHATRRSLRDFPWVLEAGFDDYSASSITDEQGRFHLGVIAFVPGETIAAGRMDAPSTAAVPIPEHSRNDLSIVIAPERRDDRPRVRGLVLDDTGRPVSGAHVAFSNDEATSDDDGRFELTVSNYDESAALSATLPRRAAAVIDRFGEQLRAREQLQRSLSADRTALDDVVLRLGGPALAISGRIVDANGKPCSGWKIDLEDRTPQGNSSMGLEAVTAGQRTDHDFPITDSNGAFTIEGLRDRDYRVRAFDESTCLVLVGEPIRAGTIGVEMRVPNDAFRPRVRGRVVSSSGLPVSGAHVELVRIRDRIRSMKSFTTCREVAADAEGRFEMLDVPRREMWLAASGAHVKGREPHPIADDDRGDDIEIVVTLVCRVRVELAAGDSADAFEIHDANDATMKVMTQHSNLIAAHDRVAREANGFPVCDVDDTARSLVLLHGKTELRRVPIELRPGDLQVITP